MKKWTLALLFLGLALAVTGCSRTAKVRAVEGDVETPYDRMGTLEVSIAASPWHISNWGWNLKNILTLTFADTSYEARLKKKLEKVAKDHQGVNHVIHVTYWPDPALKHFPDGRVYARGDMIHYKPFPAAEEAAA